MNDPYTDLGGHTTTTTPHQQFIDALPPHIRASISKTVALHTAITHALGNGWTPTTLATECGRDLPPGFRGGLIQHRIERCAHTKPRDTGIPKGVSVPWCGECAADRFRFLVDADERPVEPCPRCHPGRAV